MSPCPRHVQDISLLNILWPPDIKKKSQMDTRCVPLDVHVILHMHALLCSEHSLNVFVLLPLATFCSHCSLPGVSGGENRSHAENPTSPTPLSFHSPTALNAVHPGRWYCLMRQGIQAEIQRGGITVALWLDNYPQLLYRPSLGLGDTQISASSC